MSRATSSLDAALEGAIRLVRRDTPVVSYELVVHRDQNYSTALLSFMERIGYRSFRVEEIAGIRADVRNLHAFPSRGGAFPSRLNDFQSSPALNTAYMGNVLLPVSSRTILLHAFPCCAPKAECCPGRGGCCSHWRVDAWIKSVV